MKRPVTATEIRLRHIVAKRYLDDLKIKIHNIAYTIMFKIYLKWIGKTKIKLYELKMIKTM